MSDEKPLTWWTYDYAPTRWAIVGSFVVAWLLAIVFLLSDIVKVLAARPWWEDLIVVVATVAVPILAFLELRHSDKANRLRAEANRLRAELDAERNRYLEQIASGINRPSQEPAAILKIYPADRSRYILRPVGPGGLHGAFLGGYFEFRLRVENSGNRNSTVDKYRIRIAQFDREFNGIAPTRLNHVQGRYCQHALAPENCLNEGSLIRIPADGSTNIGSLWFFLSELTLEMLSNAGLQIQGPERRFSNLHCRLTLVDSNGISTSEDFECHED